MSPCSPPPTRSPAHASRPSPLMAMPRTRPWTDECGRRCTSGTRWICRPASTSCTISSTGCRSPFLVDGARRWSRRSTASREPASCPRTSEEVRRSCRSRMPTAPPRSTTWRPSTTASTCPSSTRSRPPAEHLVVFGRIHPDKGIADAIEIARLADRRLVICGIVQDAAYFAERVEPHIDGDRVIYRGSVGPEERAEVLASASVLLHPIHFDEPFGLSVVEAMACGTPVVAYRRGSMPEIIDEGITGFVVTDAAEAVAASPERRSSTVPSCRLVPGALRRRAHGRRVPRRLREASGAPGESRITVV